MDNAMKRRTDRINKMLEGEGFTIVYRDYQNQEGVSLQGKDHNCSPIIYSSDRIWEKTDPEVAAYLKKFYQEHAMDIDVSTIITREYILENVFPRVYSEDKMEGLKQSGIAFVPLLDMAVAFFVPVGDMINGDTLPSFNVTESSLQEIGTDLGELYQAAKDNIDKKCVIQPLEKILMQYVGLEAEEDSYLPMMVVTNHWMINGAGAIVSETVLERIAKRLGSRFIILPSSIHELVCVPAFLRDISECVNMVEEVNTFHVAPEDRLTNSVYIWDNGTLECCKQEEK